MPLVTDLSEDQVAALQAEMLEAKIIPKDFPQAAMACWTVTPTGSGEALWHSNYSQSGFEVVSLEGDPWGPIFNRDPTRWEQAKEKQPSPGEKPSKMSETNVIWRMQDGTLIHQVRTCCGIERRQLSKE